jgi:hypothetical protein
VYYHVYLTGNAYISCDKLEVIRKPGTARIKLAGIHEFWTGGFHIEGPEHGTVSVCAITCIVIGDDWVKGSCRNLKEVVKVDVNEAEIFRYTFWSEVADKIQAVAREYDQQTVV